MPYNKFYTGIGSRNTPILVLNLMRRIATHLEQVGYCLRSGGASGADSAFELGVKDSAHKQIFRANDATDESIKLASTIHPAWNQCSDYARKLHGRNCMQVLGKDLHTPSEFVICYTPNGETVGGTATAITLAKRNNIKVYNLGIPEVYKQFSEKYKQDTDISRMII